jgi:hypothetical protein
MKKFLAQFKPYLTWSQYANMERRVYTTADNFVEGYNGGTWSSFKAGDVWAVAVPSSEKKVHIVSSMNGADVITDAKSAGIALSILVVSWTWELLADGLTEEGFRTFDRVREQLMDAAEKFDAASIFSVID